MLLPLVVYLSDTARYTDTVTAAKIWTKVEMNLSIVCACLPAVYGLFKSRMLRSKWTQPRNVFVPSFSHRKAFNSESNPSDTDIENLPTVCSQVYLASTSIQGPVNTCLQPHEIVFPQPVWHKTSLKSGYSYRAGGRGLGK